MLDFLPVILFLNAQCIVLGLELNLLGLDLEQRSVRLLQGLFYLIQLQQSSM